MLFGSPFVVSTEEKILKYSTKCFSLPLKYANIDLTRNGYDYNMGNKKVFDPYRSL